jgi:DNA-binding transcriptional LysR family regulator
MDVRQLSYAVAVADAGSFTRAATAIHVAQPSLSQAIRGLEDELGVALFHRLPRGVALTDAGAVVVEAGRRLLRDLATTKAAVADVAGVITGTLDLVALPTLAVDPVAGWIGAFRAAHPGVTVTLAEPEDTAGAGDIVRHGRAELGILELPVAGTDLVARPLVRQELVAVCPPGTRRRRRLPVRDLADLPLVTTPPGTSSRQLLDDALAGAGVLATIAVQTTQREALLALVVAGAGASLLPSAMAADAARRGAVTMPLDPPVHRQVGLVHRDAPLSPAAAAFAAVALGEVALGDP